ncbi:hypothetical protein [Caulobacter sp. RHG1]|uniref:hypothetical protein n=1 Tax=Caulobacter sp. (strain RHG1) TaxID=2545762 RepID=UPI001551D2C6|nr:hypothetical protein [Caulobacter sp. RHG1]NQE64282.1 hypothetical protein [Caulobacter sp. RHG1]
MNIIRDGDVIALQGHCRVEDAEPLAALLHESPGATLDVSACESLHSAVVQAILAFGVPIVGQPAEPFLASLLIPALARSATAGRPKV